MEISKISIEDAMDRVGAKKNESSCGYELSLADAVKIIVSLGRNVKEYYRVFAEKHPSILLYINEDGGRPWRVEVNPGMRERGRITRKFGPEKWLVNRLIEYIDTLDHDDYRGDYIVVSGLYGWAKYDTMEQATEEGERLFRMHESYHIYRYKDGHYINA